jgi:hypothetical protein
MSLINFPILYIPDPDKGRPLFNGKIYVGEPDLDPTVLANQKQLNVIQEGGTVVPVAQPFVLSAGGVPVYNGNPVRLDVTGNYSIKILSKLGAQVYYISNVFEGEPVTVESQINDLSQAYEFATVEAMELDTAMPINKIMNTVIHNTTSNDGGAKYIKRAGASPKPVGFPDLAGGNHAELLSVATIANYGGKIGSNDNASIMQALLDDTGFLNTLGNTYEFNSQLVVGAKGFKCFNPRGGLYYKGVNNQAIVAELINNILLRGTKCSWDNESGSAQSFLSLHGCTNYHIDKNQFVGPESANAYFAIRVIEDSAGTGTIGSSQGFIDHNIFNVGQSAVLYQGGSGAEQSKHYCSSNIVNNISTTATLAEMIKVDLNTNMVDVSHNIINATNASSSITIEENCRNVICSFNQNSNGTLGYRLVGGQALSTIEDIQIFGGYCHGQTATGIILGSWSTAGKLSIESIDIKTTGDGIDGQSLALNDEIKIKDVDIDCTGTGMYLRNAKVNACGNTVKNAALGYYFRNLQLGSKANDNRSEEVSGRDFQLQDNAGLQMNNAYAMATASKSDSVGFLGTNTRCSIQNGDFHINATTAVMNTLTGTNNMRVQDNNHHGSGTFISGADASNSVGGNVDFP